MISASGGEDAEHLLYDHRRSAFRANRQIWGLEADVQVKTVLAGLSAEDPDRLDIASLTVSQGLRRIRRTPALLFVNEAGIVNDDGPRRSVDAETQSLLRELSSPGIPDLELEGERGMWRMSVPGQDPGLKSAMTIAVVGEHRSCISRYAAPGEPSLGPTTGVQTPTPLLVLDCLVDRRIDAEAAPTPWTDPGCLARFFADRLASDGYPDAPAAREWNVVMDNVPVASLGSGPGATDLVEVPQSGAMLSAVFERLEADPNDFSLFRVQVESSILLSRGVLTISLPPRSGRAGP